MNQIKSLLEGISELYHRLILIVGPIGSGKTMTLAELAAAENVPVLNVSFAISRKLLDLTERQRVLHLPRILEEVTSGFPANPILLDNTELLFDPVLRQDPLRLLQGLSRDRTIVATWLGNIDGGFLTYAAPEHPEYRRYSAVDLLVVCVGQEN